jgi:hypothetical protein
MIPTKVLPPPSPMRAVPRSMPAKWFADAITIPPRAETIPPTTMTGFLPTRSERAPIPRLVRAFVMPKIDVTMPICVKEVIIRTSFANNEESPLWMPQTTPARDSTKRRPAAMRYILFLFMCGFSSRMCAPFHSCVHCLK